MLGNTFSEEYFRLSRDIVSNIESGEGIERDSVTNDLRFLVNTKGSLVLTTNIFSNSKISFSRPFFSGINRVPENITILIDSINFISTNKDVSSYLPFRFRFNTEPVISLADPDPFVLDEYLLTNEKNRDLILPQVKTAKYQPLRQGAYQRDLADDRELDFLVELNNDVYTLSVGSSNVYKTDNNCQTTLLTRIDWRSIKGNESNAVGYYVDGSDDLIFVDLSTGVDFETIDSSETLIHYQLSGNQLFIYTHIGGAGRIREYVNCDGWVLVSTFNEFLTTLSDTVVSALFLTNVGYVATEDGEVLVLVFDDDEFIFDLGNPLDSGSEWPSADFDYYLYLGGNNLLSPIFNLFQVSQLDQSVSQYVIISRLKRRSQFDEFEVSSVRVDRDFAVLGVGDIKRYLNQAYFTDSDGDLLIVNLSIKDRLSLDFSRSYRLRSVFSPIYHFNDRFMVQAGNPQSEPDRVVMFEMLNNVRDVNQVFKYSYNFQGQEYPFQYTNNVVYLELELGGGKTTRDLEIFRIDIDCRIRYSKQTLRLNPSVSATEGPDVEDDMCEGVRDKAACRRRFRRGDRLVGDADRVLGLVGDDFSVQDFLNLYSIR